MQPKAPRPSPTPLFLNVISDQGYEELKEIHIFFNPVNDFTTKAKLANMQSAWRNFFTSLLKGDSIFGHLLQDYNGYKSVLILYKETALKFHGLAWNPLREITRKTNMKVLSPTSSKRIAALLQAEYNTIGQRDYTIVSPPQYLPSESAPLVEELNPKEVLKLLSDIPESLKVEFDTLDSVMIYPIVSSPYECSVDLSDSEYPFFEDKIPLFQEEEDELLEEIDEIDNIDNIDLNLNNEVQQLQTATPLVGGMNLEEEIEFLLSADSPPFSDFFFDDGIL